MLITILTIFPEIFPGPFGHSLLKKAMGNIWDLKIINIRDFAKDKHKTVDDSPYGGGPGMVMKPDVVDASLRHAVSLYDDLPKILLMTPRGQVFSHALAKSIMQENHSGMIILCGRYEGIDQRVIDLWKKDYGLMEISIGDFVVFGGEVPAMIVVETCMRFVDGIIGNKESIQSESFSVDLLEYPQYTRPVCWKEKDVPSVLLSGDHEAVAKWRLKQAEQVTREVRDDLWKKYSKS